MYKNSVPANDSIGNLDGALVHMASLKENDGSDRSPVHDRQSGHSRATINPCENPSCIKSAEDKIKASFGASIHPATYKFQSCTSTSMWKLYLEPLFGNLVKLLRGTSLWELSNGTLIWNLCEPGNFSVWNFCVFPAGCPKTTPKLYWQNKPLGKN